MIIKLGIGGKLFLRNSTDHRSRLVLCSY